MKARIAALALAGTLTASTVNAQNPFAKPGAARTPEAPVDQRVFPSESTLPEPVAPDEIKPPTMALPDDPIEPYLLTKDNGPFMVMARSFRGPEADRFALALAIELRKDYGIPAYILRTKDFPRNSNIRNVPPTAPPGMDRARLTAPEKFRTYDEAVVLVGDEKTLKGSEVLLHKVKKIKPKCLDHLPKLFLFRKGLEGAMRTTNPYVPAQNLFPGKRDRLIEQMNEGPHSIYHCSGKYTLQVAEYSGRSTFDVDGAKAFGNVGLKQSPLATAHQDAEQLASSLAKLPEIRQLGQPVYVYHDRTSSKVFIGTFQVPNDPNAVQLRENLVKLAVPIMDTKGDLLKGQRPRNRGIDKMIVPATALTDLEAIKPQQASQASMVTRSR